MTTPELIEFIKNQTQSGVGKVEITNVLLKQGWTAFDVEEGFMAVNIQTKPAQIPQSLPTSNIDQPRTTNQTPTINLIPTNTIQPNNQSPTPSAPPVNAAPGDGFISPAKRPQPIPYEPVAGFQPTQKSHKTAKMSIVIAIAILVCLGGAGAYAYYVLMPNQPSPMTLIKDGMTNTFGHTNSAIFYATTTGAVSTKNVGQGIPTSASFTIGVSGSFNAAVQNGSVDKRFTSDINADITSNAGTSTGKLDFNIQSIFINNNFYLNINNAAISYVSSDPSQAMVGGIVGAINGFMPSLENKWILISTSTISSSTSFTNGQTSLDAADMSEIHDYVNGASYIKSASIVGKDQVDGVPTYHVAAQIQDDGSFAKLVEDIILKHEPSIATSTTFEPGMTDLKNITEQALNADVWIGQNDSRIHRISIQNIEASDPKSGTQSNFSIDLVIDSQNQPVVISAPQTSVPLQELIKNIFGSYSTTNPLLNKTGASSTVVPK